MKTVVSAVYAVDVPAGLTVHTVLTLIDVNVLCTVTPDITVPSKLPPMDTFYPEYNIKLHFTPTCKLGWVPYPKIIFPIDITVAFNGVPFTRTLTSSADLEYNYATDIKTLIANKTITHESLKVEVTYPKYIRYYLLTGRKTIDKETKTFNVETGLEPPTPECTVDTTKECDDGSVITTHRCIAGKLVPTGNVCPVTPTPVPPTPGLPIICKPSISSLTTPANIPFKMPDPADLTSPPTLDISKFDIAAAISVPCVPAGTPAKLFPMDMNLTIDDGRSKITGLVTAERAGIFTSNIVSMIKDLMLTKTRAELVKLSGVKLILDYHGTVEFADANADGRWYDTKKVEKWVSIKIPAPIPVPPTPELPITCTPLVPGFTAPTSIPFKMPDLTSPPTLDITSFPISVNMSVPCVPAGTPAKLFPMDLELTIYDGISDYPPVTLTTDISGIYSADIINMIKGWVATKTPAELVDLSDSDIKLILKYPKTVEFTDTTAYGTTTETDTVENLVHITIPVPPEPECTVNTVKTCDDGSEITTHLCIGGKSYPTGNVCPSPIGCTEGTFMRAFTCPDESVIQLLKCVDGVWVDSGQKCPEAPTGVKSVYTTAPLLSRVGKRVQITGLVFCGTEKVGGEKAWILINGELHTTANTRNGTVTAEWTPVVPGLYTICVTVPASSACNAYGSACTMMQVVAELSQEEIEAAEEEFERAKERIGEIMERI